MVVHISFYDHPEKESKDYILFEDEKGNVLELKGK
ncbi:hypothetical protein J2Z37_004550 [Ammoniphilus resinae]|uniref:Uncharacterized protein n=1 Tax=Ammoniphilus resinae TaxID=861532 RepID=A0ABS4GW84_9BACL|nr:hypothetical protein [Ammoniphilus resinae]